jgi:hypothetical protein
MKRALLILTLAASLFAVSVHAAALPSVDDITKADASRIWFVADTGARSNFKSNPDAYSEGWVAGWKWAEHQPSLYEKETMIADQDIYGESAKIQIVIFGDVTKEPATTKAVAFDDAKWRNKAAG